MKLSVVATLYRSSDYIAEFVERVSVEAREFAGGSYEIVLVNDGSPDDSLDRAVSLSEQDPHVVVVDLSRNFGHHSAMMTGLEHALGDYVFLIDSDLEEDPELLSTFASVMERENCDVVYGVQARRKGGFWERWTGEVYYTIFNFLADIDHPRNICTVRLITRRYLDGLLQFQEREMVISCLWVMTGFSQKAEVINKRSKGTSAYGLAQKFGFLTNAVTSFSAAPLRFAFYVGLLILAVALVFAVYLIFNRFFLSRPLDGWTSLMVSVWLLGGMIISFMGLIGIYLSKVFSETKKRPMSIVRAVYGRPPEDRR